MSKKLSIEELNSKAAPFFKKLNTDVLFASPDGCIFEEKHRAAFHCGIDNVITLKNTVQVVEKIADEETQESVSALKERLKDCKELPVLQEELEKEKSREGGERKSAIEFINNLIKTLA